jgi:hypothetical protein
LFCSQSIFCLLALISGFCIFLPAMDGQVALSINLLQIVVEHMLNYSGQVWSRLLQICCIDFVLLSVVLQLSLSFSLNSSISTIAAKTYKRKVICFPAFFFTNPRAAHFG